MGGISFPFVLFPFFPFLGKAQKRKNFRAGTDEPRPDLANYKGTGISDPTPVGLFPNGNTPEGVADMVGNVWEWVEDWYEKDKYRTLRGGCYLDGAERLRAPVRSRYRPVVSDDDVGLRCSRD